MRAVNWERWARAAGIGFVVLFVVGFIVAGETPTVTDPTEEVISYYDGNRGQVLVSSVLFGVGWVLSLWFAGAVANLLREGGEGRLGATAIATASTFVGLQLGLTAVGAALAYSIAGDGDAGVVQALFDLAWAFDLLAALPSAGFILAASVGLMRTRAVPPWLTWAGVAVAALFVLRGTNWASDGFWSPSGGFLFIVILGGLFWILTTSVFLFLRTPAITDAVERVPAPSGSSTGR